MRASDRRRLTLMVVGFGLILFGFTVVRKPVFWAWMFPEDSKVAEPAAADEQVQPEITPADTALNPDEFIVGSANTADGTHAAMRIPYAESESNSEPGIPRVPTDLLRTIKDDVIGVHSTEAEAYYASMKLAAKVEQRRELKAPRGTYALFMDSPAGSRGVAWKITGQLRRLSEVDGGSNSFGVGKLYDAWLTTPDSGNQLVHVVASATDGKLAKYLKQSSNGSIDFPVASPPEVTCTAYFFKREGYASSTNSGISRAPMLVAGTLRHIPVRVVTSTRADELTPYLGWLTVVICMGIVFMVWSFTMSDAAHSQTRAHQLTKLPAHATFEDISVVTISEALGQMQGVESAEA